MSRQIHSILAVFSITLFVLSCFIIPVTADRLPSQVSENQLFDVDTVIDATGMIDETSTLDWIIADGNEKEEAFE